MNKTNEVKVLGASPMTNNQDDLRIVIYRNNVPVEDQEGALREILGPALREAMAETSRPTPSDEVKRLQSLQTMLGVCMNTLRQIQTTPRNAGAKRNANATVRFIETQLAALAHKEEAE